MAKFVDASPDVEKLFDEIRNKTLIPHWVEFKVLCNNKMKKNPCILRKSNDLTETLSDGINFAVIINEEIFCDLPEDMQKIKFDEVLAGVSVSSTDVLSTEKPDFNTHTSVLQKYGDALIITLHESIKSLYDAKKQKEDMEKTTKGGKRGRKPKQ